MTGFALRNLRVFFKDKTSVFFSLLAVFIIIGLYALFLGDTWTSSMGGLPGVRTLMDSWIMAGLLAVTTLTTTMGAFGIMVQDREKKIVKDFSAAPVSRASLVGGYTLGAMAIGIIMSLIALVLAEAYIVLGGGALVDFHTLMKVLGLIALCTFSNTAIMLFFVSFMTSSNAFGTASTVIGTLIGFLTGIYIPIGSLPEGVQWVIRCFPVSHGAALLRQVMMEEPMQQSFSGASADVTDSFKHALGVTFQYGDKTAAPLTSIIILLITAAVFYGLSVLSLSRKAK